MQQITTKAESLIMMTLVLIGCALTHEKLKTRFGLSFSLSLSLVCVNGENFVAEIFKQKIFSKNSLTHEERCSKV